MENIILVLVSLICGFIFLALGMSAKKSVKPANFWSGKVVKSEDIANIPEYNRECGEMWITYSFVYFLAALLSVLGKGNIAGTVIGFGGTIGIGILILRYIKIEKKYKAAK